MGLPDLTIPLRMNQLMASTRPARATFSASAPLTSNFWVCLADSEIIRPAMTIKVAATIEKIMTMTRADPFWLRGRRRSEGEPTGRGEAAIIWAFLIWLILDPGCIQADFI